MPVLAEHSISIEMLSFSSSLLESQPNGKQRIRHRLKETFFLNPTLQRMSKDSGEAIVEQRVAKRELGGVSRLTKVGVVVLCFCFNFVVG